MIFRSLILTVALVAGVAFGEAPPKPNGIKIGEGRLHLLANVRFAYDSSAGYFSTNIPGQTQLAGDLVLTPTGGLAFTMDTANTVVNFNGNAGYVWYTGAFNPGSSGLSHVTASVGLDTAFNRQGAVEFQLGDQFLRSNRSGNVAAAIGMLSLFNSVYAAAPIHPGGGAIVVTPKVRWDVEFFNQLIPGQLPGCVGITCDPNLVQNMNYSNLNFGLQGKWKFLPKTAAVLDAQFDYRTYFNRQRPTGMTSVDPNSNLQGLLLRVMGGLSGLITSRISVLLMGGAGGDWGGSNAISPLAQAELAYLGSEFTVRGGYLRTLNPVPVFGTFAQDRGYLEARATLIGRLTLRGFGSFDYLTYYAGSARRDYIVSAIAEITYQIVSFLSASVSYTLSYRGSNDGFVGINYIRHEPALLLTAQY
jgi:hypothetical protein